MSIAMIGLGAMGSAIASALLNARYTVGVWNRSSAKAEPLRQFGARVCESAADAVDCASVIVVCVSDYDAWREVSETYQLHQILEGKILIQLTTGTIDEIEAHAHWAGQCGASLVEGSLICFPRQIGTPEGSLVFAGEPQTIKAVMPVIEILSPNCTNLGQNLTSPVVLSRAMIAQALGLIFGSINGAALCRAGDIEIQHFAKQVERSQSVLNDEVLRICSAIDSGQTQTTEAAIGTWAAGQNAIREVALTLQTRTDFQDAISELFSTAIEKGLSDYDASALIDIFDPPNRS